MTASPPHAVAPVSALCAAFAAQPSGVPTERHKTGRCASVRERYESGKHGRRSPAGGFRRREKPQAAKQPAMDLSRDKNAEEMKWSPLEMGAAMQAHGA